MERFGEAAARLCNAAAVILGWSPHEFWDATPAELALAFGMQAVAEAPDAATIEALKLRFPDS
jgi:uncharacterized phage protein (TIGR02216 family)